MTRGEFQLTQRQKELLKEAKRRWDMGGFGGHRTGGDTLTTAWLGIGSATEYKPVADAGLMEVATGLNKGHSTWWKLTEKGVLALIVLGWIEEIP